jgi:release factor glutamine methyltransferase
MNIREALSAGESFLTSLGIANSRLDAELILCDLAQMDRTALLTHLDRLLDPLEETVFWEWLDRRARNYPMQYLRGFQEFYGRVFQVNPNVLIPRPETEILVEESLDLIRSHFGKGCRILDFGTGSGCIAISLSCEMTGLQIIGVDISAGALDTARKNSIILPCLSRISWIQSDGLAPFLSNHACFDLIVSNPPYVSLNDKMVDSSVAFYEPKSSVFAGISGLEIYQQLLSLSRQILSPGGYLVLELGYKQVDSICRLANSYGWRIVKIKMDLAGIERCIVLSNQ